MIVSEAFIVLILPESKFNDIYGVAGFTYSITATGCQNIEEEHHFC